MGRPGTRWDDPGSMDLHGTDCSDVGHRTGAASFRRPVLLTPFARKSCLFIVSLVLASRYFIIYIYIYVYIFHMQTHIYLQLSLRAGCGPPFTRSSLQGRS